MVWGYGVEQAEVFTVLLEQRRPTLEVINLGVSGYGTDQEYLLLQREGGQYKPDLLILVFCENDFVSNIRSKMFLVYQKPLFTLDPHGLLVLRNVPVPRQTILERAGLFLTRHLYLINLAATASAEFSVRGIPNTIVPTAETNISKQFPVGPDEHITVAMINLILKTSKNLGADFLLVLTDGMGRRGREMKAFFETHGMRVVNLDDAGLSKLGPRRYHLPDEVHWNALGHQAVADYLLKYLDSRTTR
jgi:lysophospholipase L1-like esterase